MQTCKQYIQPNDFLVAVENNFFLSDPLHTSWFASFWPFCLFAGLIFNLFCRSFNFLCLTDYFAEIRNFFQDPDFFAAQPNLLNLLVTFFTWRNFFSWFDRKRWFWFVTLDSLYCTILYCTYFCRRMNWTLHTILPNHRRLFSHSGASERDFTIVKFELWVQQNRFYSRVWFTKSGLSTVHKNLP